MLKRNALALAVASMTMMTTANAAMYSKDPAPKACTGVDVTVPCAAQGWDIGIQALYVQPRSQANNYWGYDFNNNNTDFNFRDVDPEWTWGVRVEGSYHFNTGNDVNINWTHFNNTTQRTENTGRPFVFPSYPVPPPTGPVPPLTYNESRAFNDVQFDVVNIEFAQHTDFGTNKNIRFHGGLSYARINYVNGFQAIQNQNRWNEVESMSDFSGIGPRFGMDMSYDFDNGFSLLANMAGSILAGTLKNTTTITQVFQAGPNPNQTNTAITALKMGKNAIVPSAELKLGAKYTKAMEKGDFTVEGGWVLANYWQSVQNTNIIGLPSLRQTNFGYQGPYIGVKWVGPA